MHGNKVQGLDYVDNICKLIRTKHTIYWPAAISALLSNWTQCSFHWLAGDSGGPVFLKGNPNTIPKGPSSLYMHYVTCSCSPVFVEHGIAPS